MDTRLPRLLLGVSALGATLFIGIFGWLYLLGYLPIQYFAIAIALNFAVAIYSLKMRARYRADRRADDDATVDADL